ncbi:MAG TPA: hypothetical protein DIW20_08590 [Rhodospirillaceae bacterium]|nr:hypothetical protein [Rhodospirillaceae bacterium]
MFRKKPAAPLTLPQKTRLYEKRLADALRIETPGGRYQALALLLDDMDKDIAKRDKDFHEGEDRRMVGTLLGMGAGIPLAAGVAALAGAPLAILVLVPAVMSSGIYASHKNREATALFNAENKSCLPVIARIRSDARAAQDDMLRHHTAALAASPQHADLMKNCPHLKGHFDAAQGQPQGNTAPANQNNAPHPLRRHPPFGG